MYSTAIARLYVCTYMEYVDYGRMMLTTIQAST